MVMSTSSTKKKKRESSRQRETVDSKTIIRRVQLRAPLIDTLEMRVAVQGGSPSSALKSTGRRDKGEVMQEIQGEACVPGDRATFSCLIDRATRWCSLSYRDNDTWLFPAKSFDCKVAGYIKMDRLIKIVEIYFI